MAFFQTSFLANSGEPVSTCAFMLGVLRHLISPRSGVPLGPPSKLDLLGVDLRSQDWDENLSGPNMDQCQSKLLRFFHGLSSSAALRLLGITWMGTPSFQATSTADSYSMSAPA